MATQLVDASAEYQAYLRCTAAGSIIADIATNNEDYPGSLKPVKRLQEQTLRVQQLARQSGTKRQLRPRQAETHEITGKVGRPEEEETDPASGYSSDESYTEGKKESRDEAMPNAAIILLLQGFTSLVKGALLEWVFDRVHFRARFRRKNYKAYSDEALRSTRNECILAIVETKKTCKDVKGRRYHNARKCRDGRLDSKQFR
ncbi:hypothetical protein TSTA_002400 [Talaromyces stipitatus ATCC 10500]|uniref:Uncharacterized protein n=1 Tax=Talaromyces stipitatus (strain ATCC 10500 / CBS 375.48 / QM 6759 / NRRL 1006) TaxID=441959 RepID=B8MT77_TALSN|nr:uncharacterized protein TSTA_002400 [Talaromyces stipitatus ATCC 10500]EED12174.1 hypothetical protein TSTA_002400 [Talaromyces stipitatus ATCC 10500]